MLNRWNQWRRVFSTQAACDFQQVIREASSGLDRIKAVLYRPEEQKYKETQEQLAAKPDLWDDPRKASGILQKLAVLQDREKRYNKLEEMALECRELYGLAQEENDSDVLADCTAQAVDILQQVKKLNVSVLLSEPSDSCSCFLEIQAGAGGTESCDWVEMLLRMYMRWAESRGYSVELSAQSPGDEAGLRNAMIRLDGAFSYGWSKTESGVHRLVRVSPFDSQSRRHTSFAQVRVYPITESSVETRLTKPWIDGVQVEINSKDIRIDTYRSSGAGGQHVNKTDSAVRITHIPTGIVTQCQSDRSQHRNKAVAMAMLQAKLAQRELEQKLRDRAKYTEGLGNNEWGSQIRSYVLHPYQMVKDHRTNLSIGNAQSVLDGDITPFIEAVLSHHQ